ncbi:MAG TPA: HAMP domain-containing protein, partial [Bacteroidia bacterium]|nr:HAMP domain-containing protein [Bacteroidia bacterium]
MKPSLGLVLLVGSLVTAGVGASVGLCISYLHETKSKRLEIVSEFTSKSAVFSHGLTPQKIAELSLGGEEMPPEIQNYLDRINYTYTPDTEARVSIFLQPEGDEPESIRDFATGGFPSVEDDALLQDLIAETGAQRPSTIVGFPGDETTVQGISHGLRSIFGTGSYQTIGSAFRVKLDGQFFLVVSETRVSPRLLGFTQVMQLRHFLPLLGIVPLFASLIFLGSWFTKRLQGLAEGMNTVTEGRYDYRLREAGPPEIERVHACFNAMAESLRKTTDQF